MRPQQQQDYYNPSTQYGFDDGTVLKPIKFKPLRNRKTGNFFSYHYGTIERNRSGNSDSNMEWVTKAPPEMQRKIDEVRIVHDEIRDLYQKLKVLTKKGTLYQVDEVRAEIGIKFDDISEIIYPDNERVYVESSEARRSRLEQQNELTLDDKTIAALMGHKVGPAPGSTADASIAEAKLKLAEEKLANMQIAIDEQAQAVPESTDSSDKDAEIAMLREQLKKPPSRRKAEFKNKD